MRALLWELANSTQCPLSHGKKQSGIGENQVKEMRIKEQETFHSLLFFFFFKFSVFVFFKYFID